MKHLDIAEAIAERLEEREPSADMTTFASGAAGDALFFLALAQTRSTERWALAAHRSIKIAATGGQATLPGLFTGLAGLLFVTAYAARMDDRYAKLRDQCAKALAVSGATTPPLRPAARAKEYDLVSGVAGLHAALLYAGCHDQARDTRTYLEWLLADDDRWKCEHEIVVERGPANDLGIAHGLAGILSVLAADEDSDLTTLERAAEFLWQNRVPSTTLWPSSIGSSHPEPARAAWCYGNPGIAMALLRVGRRTGSAPILEYARAALHATIDSPRGDWGQIDTALCHGTAGNGLIFHIAARALADERIGACASELERELVEAYDATLPFGYRNWDNLRNCWSDDPTLMTGAAGIGLALVTLQGAADPSWSQSFAMAETSNVGAGASC